MPDAKVTFAARMHIHSLRTEEPGLDEVGTDGYVLAPILSRLNAAVADLLEWHVNVSGGPLGVTDTAEHLSRLADALPSPWPSSAATPTSVMWP